MRNLARAAVVAATLSGLSPDAAAQTASAKPEPHRIEVQKEGLRTYSSTVNVRAGEAQSLNISLVRE